MRSAETLKWLWKHNETLRTSSALMRSVRWSWSTQWRLLTLGFLYYWTNFNYPECVIWSLETELFHRYACARLLSHIVVSAIWKLFHQINLAINEAKSDKNITLNLTRHLCLYVTDKGSFSTQHTCQLSVHYVEDVYVFSVHVPVYMIYCLLEHR